MRILEKLRLDRGLTGAGNWLERGGICQESWRIGEGGLAEVRHANENLVTKWCFLSQKGRKWGGVSGR